MFTENLSNFPAMASVAMEEATGRKHLSIEEILAHRNDYRTGNPAVYCGTYGKYNDGSIFGMWIDLTTFDDYEEFIEFCQRLHADEEDPELMFQDYECFPSSWYSESCFDEVTFENIKMYGEADDKDAIDAYLECFNTDSLEGFEDKFMGEWDSEKAFAEHIIDECYDLSSMGILANYFDYDAFARDLFLTEYTFYRGYVFNVY